MVYAENAPLIYTLNNFHFNSVGSATRLLGKQSFANCAAAIETGGFAVTLEKCWLNYMNSWSYNNGVVAMLRKFLGLKKIVIHVRNHEYREDYCVDAALKRLFNNQTSSGEKGGRYVGTKWPE
jgi:hypothetical protein